LLQAFNLTTDMLLVIGLLFLVATLFISSVIRVDVVAVLVLVILGLTQLLPPERLFAGFSSEAVISLIAIMIISAGLENAGISVNVAKWMLRIGKERPHKILFLLMVITGLFASFMRSVGAVSVFLPIVTRITARTKISKTFLLLPIAFCTILGGMLTMVGTSPLIILNSLLKNANEYAIAHDPVFIKPFQLFDVLPIGLMLLLAGIIYLHFISYRFFATSKPANLLGGNTKEHFKKIYNKGGDIYELKISKDSSLINSTLKDLELTLPNSLSVIAIMQNGDYHFPPLRRIAFNENTTVALMGDKDLIKTIANEYKLIVLPSLNAFAEILHPIRSGLCEIVIPPNSQFVGQEVRELHMRRNYQLHTLALLRGNKVYHGDELNRLILRPGDTLGMFGRWEALMEFSKHPDFFVLTTTYPRDRTYPEKMPHALFFFMIAILLVIFGHFPISVGLLVGAVGMIATRVLSIDQAYDSVSWKTVFLIAGLIPLGLVMQTTGTTAWLIQCLHIEDLNIHPWYILVGLTIISTLFALIISNIGATVLLVPIAIDLALNLGANPRLYAFAVALAASNTFIIPTHQVNALITGTGGYSTKDFVKVGGGMTIIFWCVMLLGLYLFYP
jgi:di/tricarboxylate transporter